MYNNISFAEAVESLGVNIDDVPKEKSNFERYKIKKMLQNDSLVAKIYNLTKDELSLIIDNFTIFNKKYPQYRENLIKLYGN